MTVIAMTQEIGTLGKDVAARLAATLDIEVVHHGSIARHPADPLDTNVISVNRFVEPGASFLGRWSIASTQLSRLADIEVLEKTKMGNALIRGWGAVHLLADVPHVICVRIHARMADRIAEVMERFNVPNEKLARRAIERSDKALALAIRHRFCQDWREPTNYDIILNTSRTTVDACASQIQLLAEHPSYAETDASRIRLQEKLLEERVRMLLRAEMADTAFGSAIRLEVSAGTVRLHGTTTDPGKLEQAIQRIQSIEDVTEILNETQHFDFRYGM
ncbi:MAG: AAA family ATPase [Hyphomicrobiaceae bacterium]